MITAELNDYFEWNGEITKCQWINTGSKSIGFVITKTVKCPNCGEFHEIESSMNVIESSPQFQDIAKPINTIKS